MRRPLIFAATALAAAAVVGGALAFQSGSSEPRITSVLGEAPASLDRDMSAAQAAGAYSITCGPAVASTLTCTPMKDEDVIPALKGGEVVYGRTVIGFPNGAEVVSDSTPQFEKTDLVCSDALECTPVTEATPTVAAGTELFVFYRRHNVTFDENGHTVSHLDAPTVSLRVVPASG